MVAAVVRAGRIGIDLLVASAYLMVRASWLDDRCR
jgi:hypothetical protein